MNTRALPSRSLIAAVFMAGFTGTVLAQQAIRPAGLGTPEQPYLIRQLGELVWAQDPAEFFSHYRLENDIDAAASQGWPGGFKPIANPRNPFRGNLDGAGFVVRNLKIARSVDVGVGLFGGIGTNGVVRNLRIEDASVLGSSQVGILAGLNQGTISNCVVTGRVEGSGAVGGIAGENSSFSTGFFTSKTGRLLQSSARVEVNGIQNVGGLAGINSGTIVESFSTGRVQSPTAGYATGGLVGGNLHGVIDRSSSSAVTEGGERVGGLVGFHSGNTNGLIHESFSVGPVSGRPTSTGGLVGHASSKARTESSYWDTGSSGQSFSAAGTGLDSGRLRNPTNLTGWAVGTVWTAGPVGSLLRHAWAPPLVRVEVLSQGPGTARLLTDNPNQAQGSKASIEATANANAEFLGWRGVGIAQAASLQTEVAFDIDQQVVAVFRSVHEIRTPAEFRRIGREPGYTLSDRYRLMADLDFTGEPGLSPIGPDSTNSFTGVFDGNGHTLRNLQIGTPTNSTSALFGWVGAGGEIRDLHLTDAQVTGQSRVAGIASVNLGRISGSTLTGQVAGRDDVGGIAGINHGVIEDCRSAATIAGLDHVGGIAGSHVRGRITRPSFQGRVEGGPGGHSVGGICGWSDSGIIEGAEVAGAISGSYFIGGVFGILQGSELTGFHGTNLALSGRFATGGIAGALRDATVTDSTAHGTVTSIDSVGGAFGHAYRSSALRMQTDMQTTGKSEVGGLVGSSLISTWDEIHTTGQVQGEDRVGGWAGTLEGGGLGNARNDAPVSGRQKVGGGVGRLTGVLADTRAEGPVSGDSHVGGLVGENWTGSIVRSQAHGSVEGTESVGGLVGLNFGSIDASTASGSVHAELLAGGLVGLNRNGSVSRSTASGAIAAPWAAGGLVGENYRGQIFETAAGGQVSGDYRSGGLVGGNYGGTVSESSASGLVLGGNRAGGLVGENTVGGRIERSASSTTVHGISEVGGLVGYNGDSVEIPRVVESVASGSVLGNGARIGGLIGFNEPGPTSGPGRARGIVENSYHLAGQGSPDSPPAGTAVSRAQLHQQATFVGWNFISDWNLSEGVSTPRPAWQEATLTLRVVVDGPGSVSVSPVKAAYVAGETVTLTATPEAGPNRLKGWFGVDHDPLGAHTITLRLDTSRTVLVEFDRIHRVRSVEELARIGRDPAFGLGDHYVLAHDIDASATRTWNDVGTSESVLEGFPPIGSESEPFTGTLDGQGHTVRQLQIARSGEESVGLFSVTGRGARIQDLEFTEASINGLKSVGIVAGNNWGATLERIRVQGEATGLREVGLVTGVHQAALVRGIASGKVTVVGPVRFGYHAGGITGHADHALLRDTHFTGSVLGAAADSGVGGVVGLASQSDLGNVFSSGTVDGPAMAGGIAGQLLESSLDSAWSAASINGGPNSRLAGGLVGYAFQSTVRRSGFGGSVHAHSSVGGLVGQAFFTRIDDSFSTGAVGIADVSVGVGGLIGQGGDLSISRSYVNGSIAGQSSLAALHGTAFAPITASSVYWNQEAVGAAIPVDSRARSAEALRDPATFVGWDLTSVWAIDPLRHGGFPFLRGLPYSGLTVPGEALHQAGGSLLTWIAARQPSWTVPDLGAIPSADLLTAYLLDREPAAGLHRKLELQLHRPTVHLDQLLLDADLTLDSQPVNGTLQARWIVESATDPEGPWERLDWTDQTPPLVAGRTRFELPAPAGNLFRVRIEPGLLR